MHDLTQTSKALSDPSRVRILKMLQLRPLCVCEITAVLQLSPSTVSKHISLLRQANLISDHKEGKWVICQLEQKPASQFAASVLPLLANWLNDDPQVMADREKLTKVSRFDLC